MRVISIFGLSDLHLSFGADKPMDIFGGWNDYVPRIKNNWQRVVSPSDTVVIPGDISWALKLEDTLKDFEFINELPGQKLIVKGNHDLWWSTMNKMTNFLYVNGIDTVKFVHNCAVNVGEYSVCGSRGWLIDENEHSKKVILREAARLEASLSAAYNSGKEPLVFLHYPPVFNGQSCAEIMDVLKRYNVAEVWHGHIHGAGKQYAVNSFEGIKFRLISCDCVDFSPVLIK